MEEIKRQYELCLAKLNICFTDTSIDAYRLRKIITLYCGGNLESIPLELKSAKTTELLIQEISHQSSWFNYNLLELLLQLFNHQEGLEILLQYEKEHLNPYLERASLPEISASLPSRSIASASHTRCVLVADRAGLTGKDAIIITRRLSEELQMPSLQLLDCCDDVHLIFGIHSEVFCGTFSQKGSLLQQYLQWDKEEEIYAITIDIAKLLPTCKSTEVVPRIDHPPKRKGNLQSNISMLDNVIRGHAPHGVQYFLWLDRQVRPTIGVSARKGRTRQEVGPMFTEMLATLTDFYQQVIPDNMADVHIVYSIGAWQRSRNFHIKAHLPTPIFLALTDKLCEQNSLGHNMFHSIRDELEKRQRNHYHGLKLQRLFASACEDLVVLHSTGSYYVGVANAMHYPLLLLYQVTHDGHKNTVIAAAELPQAVEALEAFAAREWQQPGLSINMIIATTRPVSGAAASPSWTPCYHVTAVIEETEFAQRTGKDIAAVEAAWDRGTTERKYHKNNARFKKN